MKLHLEREYWPGGTNGTITIDGHKICHTIEKPWRRNTSPESCIPEGVYNLKREFSEKWGWHIVIEQVPGRGEVRFLPRNWKSTELPDCIIPVAAIKGEGVGIQSKHAFEKLKDLVFSILNEQEQVLLEIRSYPDAALNLVHYELSWMD